MYKQFILFALVFSLFACGEAPSTTTEKEGPLQVVTTTTMITDLVKNIGGDAINVNGLMGAGVDPHLYKASEGDVNKLFNADMVFYNGLHLEGKLEDIFEKMKHRGVAVIALGETIDKKELIPSENFASNYDPHIWFNISLWKKAALFVADQLAKNDAKNAGKYNSNLNRYLDQLNTLDQEMSERVNTLPKEERILITAHDAFNYFGLSYQFEVLGLQGISTATEAGVQDVQALANLIFDKQVKAIFVESSVPQRNIEALQAAVANKGFEVKIGGELFSDALGTTGTEEGTYIGMFRHNVNTIVNGLK